MPGWRPAAAVVVALAVLYAGLILALPADLFWSPDEGSKFLQLESYRRAGGLRQSIVYGARAIDPGFRYYPSRLSDGNTERPPVALYPQPLQDGRLESNWAPLFPLMTLIPFHLLGFRGLYVLPAASGLLTALLAGRAARSLMPGTLIPTVLAVGLCSPVLFFSLLFWEHTVALCLAMAALVLCLDDRSRPRGRALVIGGCLAVAIVLRFEFIVVALALATASATQSIRRRLEFSSRISRSARSWVPVAALASLVAAAFGLVWLGVRQLGLLRPLGAKVDWLVRLSLGQLTQLSTWSDLPSRLRRSLIDLPAETGPMLDPMAARIGLLGILLAASSRFLREPARGWLFVSGAVLVTVVSAVEVVSADRFRSVHALVLPAPWMVFALLLVFPVPRDVGPGTAVFRTASTLVLAAAVLLSLNPIEGGLEWGSRFQLAAYVLAAVFACAGVVAYLRSTEDRRLRAAVGLCAVAAFGVGFLFQLRGFAEVWTTKSDLATYRVELETAGAPAVTDLPWLPGSLATTFADSPILTVGGPEDLGDLIGTVAWTGGRFRIVTVVESESDADAWIEGARPYRAELVRDRERAGLRFLDVRVHESHRLR